MSNIEDVTFAKVALAESEIMTIISGNGGNIGCSHGNNERQGEIGKAISKVLEKYFGIKCSGLPVVVNCLPEEYQGKVRLHPTEGTLFFLDDVKENVIVNAAAKAAKILNVVSY